MFNANHFILSPSLSICLFCICSTCFNRIYLPMYATQRGTLWKVEICCHRVFNWIWYGIESLSIQPNQLQMFGKTRSFPIHTRCCCHGWGQHTFGFVLFPRYKRIVQFVRVVMVLAFWKSNVIIVNVWRTTLKLVCIKEYCCCYFYSMIEIVDGG